MTVLLTERFSQVNGNLANGWADASAFGSADPIVQVAAAVGTTTDNTRRVATKTITAVAANTNFRYDCYVVAPNDIGAGGVTLVMFNPSTFAGLGFFIGNATHIKVYAVGGTDTNITNDGRDNEGLGGVTPNQVTFTHTSAGLMQILLDGVVHSSATDTSLGSTALSLAFIILDNALSPASQTTIDDLFIQNVLTAPPPDIAPGRLWVPTSAAQRAAGW